MQRVSLPSLFVVAVVGLVCGNGSSAQAQYVYGGSVAYAPVVTYRPVVVAPAIVVSPVVVSRPYVTYSSPSAVVVVGGTSGHGVGPKVVRDRYNYGLFGHYNHHHHARGPGFGHAHYHTRSPGYYGYWW